MDIKIRSVSKCALCMLQEQGVKNPEDYVLPQYIMTDPTKPPVPVNAEGADSIMLLFPEDEPKAGEFPRQSGGVVGTVRAMYRAMGFGKQEEAPAPESRVAALRNRKSSLYD